MATIDESVVRILPDFTGFKPKLRRDLKAATAGIEGKVRLIADVAGFRASARDALRSNQGTIENKIRLTADATGFQASVNRAVRAKQITARVRLEASTTGLQAQVNQALRGKPITIKARAEVDERQTVRQAGQVGDAAGRSFSQRLRASTSRAGSLFDSIPTGGSALSDWSTGSARPMHLLVAAGVALSPVLIAVASSAVQASTSMVALGAAGYGAVAATVGVVQAFGGVVQALKLREQAVKSQQSRAARAASDDIARQTSIRNAVTQVASAERALGLAQRDATSAQRNLNLARADALRDLRDLRETVSDLALDEQGASLALERARQSLADTNRDAAATDLDRRDAAHSVAVAEDRLSDVQRDRADSTKELHRQDKAGVDGSQRVMQAREQVAAATERVAEAQRRVTEAQADLTAARRKGIDAADATSAAETQLATQLAKLSPAARRLYNWWVDHEQMFDGMRRKMEQAILPGFLSFLRDVTKRGKDSKSALDLAADGSAAFGRSISRTVARVGALTATPWFHGALIKLNAENEKSFNRVGSAATLMVKPMTRLVVAASPLMTRFAGYLESIAQRFNTWIASFSDAQLSRWFKDAGDELAVWGGIVTDLGSTLLSIFRASLPAGNTLVERLKSLTGSLADWAKGEKGQKQIKSLFDTFARLDYAKIAKTIGQVTGLIAIFKGARWAAGLSPLNLLLAALAISYPEQTREFLEKATSAMVRAIEWAQKHPRGVAALLALLAAYKGLSAISNLKLPKLPGLPGSGSKTATMTVQAGVVNVYGAAAGGKAPAVVPGGVPGGKPPAGGMPSIITGGARGGLVAAATAAVAVAGGWGYGVGDKGKTPLALLQEAIERPAVSSIAKAVFGVMSPAVWIGNLVALIKNQGLTGAIATIGAQAGQLSTVVTQRLTPIITWFKSLPGRAMSALAAWPGRMAELGGNLVGWCIVGLVRGVPALWNWFGEVGVQIKQKFVEIGLGIFAWAQTVPDQVGKFFDLLPGRIDLAIKNIPSLFSNLWERVKTTFRNGINSAIGLLNSFIGGINKVTGKFGITPIPTLDPLAAPNPNNGIINQATRAAANRGALAEGGKVRGFSPNSKADNIPAWLTADEYVQPVDAVRHYGVGFMEAVRRKELPRFADGGLVGLMAGLPGKVINQVKGALTSAAGHHLGGKLKVGGALGDILRLILSKVPDMGTALGHLLPDLTTDAPASFSGPLPNLGSWPSSPGAQRGNSGIWRSIVALVKKAGIPHRVTSSYRHGDPNWHGSGRAVDLGGFNQDRLAGFFMSMQSRVLELIHRSNSRDYAVTRGRNRGSFNAGLMNAHRNHVHIAMARGGPVVMDTGGTLYPGQTAVNRSRQPETIRTAAQERALQDQPMVVRLDPRDIAALAAHIVAAGAQQIVMDGRRVAEVVRGYDYVPRGAW